MWYISSTMRTKLFRTNRTQAVRLPKPVALPESVREVDIAIVGSSRVITPAGHLWDDFFAGPHVSDDFMADRRQPPPQKRDTF
jgi:antitoxin VapB